MKQEQLDLFELEKPVIKGFPELRWTGKRPYTSTQFFPAQLKETYGTPDSDGWINKIFWGDNLQVMSHLLKDFRGKIKLIYIDPPFDSKADYKKKINLRGKTLFNDNNSFEEKQYGDIWTNDEYLQFMYERLILLKELLADDGTIYLHCDWHKSHQLRCLMDEVFGANNFINEIVWCRTSSSSAKASSETASTYLRAHDNIFIYAKELNRFEGIYKNQFTTIEYSDRVKNSVAVDENGNTIYKRGKGSIGGIAIKENVEVDIDQGMLARDWWTDIPILRHNSKDNVNYPTQKPEKLLERVIAATTKEGDLVFDCFMGSGTTQAVALKLGRKFIGSDINLGAIQTATKRLINILNDTDLLNNKKIGFSVYNVNNYDFFRNPVEAKELLIEALQIQKFNNSTIFDGELDGRNVKILPVNRIATKADLGELVSNLPYSLYEKKAEENTNEIVDRITLICMGHEPDLSGAFKQMIGKYNVDVEILDILRDKNILEFKRDSQVDIKLSGTSLKIKQFYPMNLMQKLSMQKEEVDNWKQLVDSVYIDYNYDGETLSPQIIDIPDKENLVSGIYEIPRNHGRILIKITDLLSESLEIEVN